MDGLEKFGVSYEKNGKKYFCFHPWFKKLLREYRKVKRLDKKYLR